MAAPDLIACMEQALYESADRPGLAEVVARPDWFRFTTPNAPTPYRNGVLRAILDPDDVPGRIAETIAHYRALGVPFRWVLTPSTRPGDLGTHLRAAGLAPFERLECLWAPPTDFPAPTRADVAVVRVDAATMDAALDCQARAWDFPPAALPRFRREMHLDLTHPERGGTHFLASLDGEPAGTGSVVCYDDFAHFSGSAVVPAMRRRGVYRELILARMAFLRDAGVSVVTNHCVSTTSAPICRALGFEHVCDFEVLAWHPPA